MTDRAGILVFGATGMLGQALIKAGISRGISMVGVARSGTDESCDIESAESISEIVARLSPIAIINAAAMTDLAACEIRPTEAYKINARSVAFLVAAIHHTDCRLIHISTDHYFSGDGCQLHDEYAEVRLLNEYARTKYAGEAFAATCPRALIIRTNIAGFRGWPGQPTFAEWMFDIIEQDAPVGLFDDFVTSTMDATRMAQVTLDLVGKGATGLLNVAARDAATKRQFVNMVAMHLGKPLTRSSASSVAGLKPRRANSLALDVTAAEAVLGFRLPTMEHVAASLVREYHERCAIKPVSA